MEVTILQKGSNLEKITIPDPAWGSDLANIILDLEKLRTKRLGGDVPPWIFFQIKEIFQILETIGSARIEGNNTTLSEYVEKIIEQDSIDEQTREIQNLERAIEFIETNTDKHTHVNRAYISELHKIISEGLTPPPRGEGSNHPGELRKHNVKIKGSSHTPPDFFQLPELFESFVEFVNREHKEQYQLLMVAIAHHRFEYLHLFDNGNGRMGRLLNYAFLIKLGFQVRSGRILNPSTVFYTDRDKYYEMLSRADSLEDEDLLAWAEYFLLGLKNEIEKIDSLLQVDFVRKKLLTPMLKHAKSHAYINENEFKVLHYLVAKDNFALKAKELEDVLGVVESKKKSLAISKMRQRRILMPIEEGRRVYTLAFGNNYLLRSMVSVLHDNGFVSNFLEQKPKNKSTPL